MQSTQKTKRTPNPRASANFFSVITFWWTLKIFLKGFKRDLILTDIIDTLPSHESKTLGDAFARDWAAQLRKRKKPSLLLTIVHIFGKRMLFYGILIFITECVFRLHQPYLLALFIKYFTIENKIVPIGNEPYLLRIYNPKLRNETQVTKSEALVFASGVIFISLVYILIMHLFLFATLHLGMKMRVAVGSLIYRKSLRLSNRILGEISVGQVINIMSSDVLTFDIAFMHFHYVWLAPVQCCIITWLLYIEVGVAALLGFAAVIIFLPSQFWIGLSTAINRFKICKRSDERVRRMNEIIIGVQVIKMYTWEKPFTEVIGKIRKYEVKAIRGNGINKGLTMSFIMFVTRVAIFAIILYYVHREGSITSDKVFMVVSYYMILRHTITNLFPTAVTQISETYVSVRRVETFMGYEEALVGLSTIREKDDKNSSNHQPDHDENFLAGVEMKNIFAKHKPGTDYDLKDVTIDIPPRNLTMIIGTVGSGKSSILEVILKEVPIDEGMLVIDGTVSYASQEPWLFAGTVRQNILFGQNYDKDRYKNVIKACALMRDFRLLPHGDRTYVGERGVSLSGGQRARINLARAVYKQAHIYLLDDPLSAVDTLVAKQLFDECIRGYLREKTVVLVTHQLQFLTLAEHIVLMHKGEVMIQGSHEELKASGLDFAQLVTEAKPVEQTQPTVETLIKQISFQSTHILRKEESELSYSDQQETITTGHVGCHVYIAYGKATGHTCYVVVIPFLFLLTQAIASLADYWLGLWVEAEDKNYIDSTLTRKQYEDVYTIIIISVVFCSITRSLIFVYASMQASINLHNQMFESVCRASMKFFNKNPSGRIINRFSKDMNQVDEQLPAAFIDTVQLFLNLVGAIFVIMFINYWFIIPIGIILIMFFWMRYFYLSTSRSIKRLEGVTKSNVFVHLNASLQGLSTIRVGGAEPVLIAEFDNHQNLHSGSWYMYITTSRAFGIWLDVICVVFIASVTYSFFLIDNDGSGSNVGVAVTQCISLTGLFQWAMRQSAELENLMTSVERILEYSDPKIVEPEPPLESDPKNKPPDIWPTEGRIEFRNVNLQYSNQSGLVLRNLNFVIQPKEKIGIVGRTGAGKSSLIMAIYLLANIAGEINIDGVNTKIIGLHDLRRKISIIPQEPVLFTGTMRYNLDPFDEFKDHVLYRALEIVDLLDSVRGLDYQITEEGANFSVGQRQLVCLARAIVRANKILVLDEATANVDPQTDALIQTTIRRSFQNCTVLTIAHRLHTIMDSDRIIVMDAGTMVEYDHPFILLQNGNGYLKKMVEQTGPIMSEVLHHIAESSYSSKIASQSQNLNK